MFNRRYSLIWQYFSSETDNRVNCLICNQTLSFSNKSTYALIRHLARRHPKDHHVYKNSFRVCNRSKSTSQVSAEWLRETEMIPADTTTIEYVASEMHPLTIVEEDSTVQKLMHGNNVIDDDTIYINDSDYTDDTMSQFPTSEYRGEPHRENAVSPLPNSKSTQTEEDTKDHINCGFVKVSKGGTEKHFHLHCFYCDAEYPIIFWSEFSKHILYNHSHLEEAYDDPESTLKKQCFFDYSDTENDSDTEADIMPQNLDESGKIQQNRCDSELIDISSENSDTLDATAQHDDDLTPNKCTQNDLSASINGDKPVNDERSPDSQVCEPERPEFISGQGLSLPLDSPKPSGVVFQATTTTTPTTINDDSAAIDEISLGETNHNIIIDFLDHLKALPSLWLNSKADSEKYDQEILNLRDKLNLKWSLNLTTANLCKGLENIKAWFHKTKAEKEKNLHLNNNQFNEYYEKCAELLTYESNANNQQLTMPAEGGGEVLLISKIIAPPPSSIPSQPQPPPEPSPSEELALDCNECKKKFECASELKEHLKIHPKGYRPYTCKLCDSRFKTKWKRNEHVKKHTSEGFKCDICSKKIVNLFSLKIHMNVHKGIYPYFCEWCGRRYASLQHCKEHRQYAHLGYGVCKICNREYTQRSILQKHLRSLHRPTFGTNEELAKRCPRPRYLKQSMQKQRQYELKQCPSNNTNNNNALYDTNFGAAAASAAGDVETSNNITYENPNNIVTDTCSSATNIISTGTPNSPHTVGLTVEISTNYDPIATEKAYASPEVKEEEEGIECGEYEFITNSMN